MSNELAAQIGVSPELLPLLTPQQQGWLRLSQLKTITFGVLEKNELKVQALLLNCEAITELPEIQDKLKQAKDVAAEAKDARLQFTRMIDEKLYSPAMLFEARNNVLILVAIAHELKLRTAAAKEAEAGNELNKEIDLFKAHVINEYFRIATEYRDTLDRRITFYYTGALQQKMPVAALEKYKQDIRAELPQIELSKFVKFDYKVMTKDKAMEIFGVIHAYNPEEDLKAAIQKIDTKFAMYAEDLQNAEAAITAAKENQEKESSELKNKLTQEVAVNNLTAQAQLMVMSNAPKVKKMMKVQEADTEAWGLAVMSNFIKNWSDVKEYVKVKQWGNLKVSQMAEALGKLNTEKGTKLSGLVVIEISK